MSRKLLILALLVSGTGCSTTRPLFSTLIVTPPKVSFRQLPREDAWRLTAVAVAYPSESLAPLPCAPSPVVPVERMTYFEEDERHASLFPNGEVPSGATVVPVPSVHVPAPAPPTIAHLEHATSPQSEPNVSPVPLMITPIVQTAVVATSPSGSVTPPPCAASPERPLELVTFCEADGRSAPQSPSGPVSSGATVVPVPSAPALLAIVHPRNATSPQSVYLRMPSVASVPLRITPIIQTASTETLEVPHVRVESPPPTELIWKPATVVSLESPVQTSTANRCDLEGATRADARPVLPVDSLSPPVMVPPDFSELLTEIRNQRQLIEALQRDLTRERSADDAAIDELEAAVENLLVQTQTAPHKLPTTLQKP